MTLVISFSLDCYPSLPNSNLLEATIICKEPSKVGERNPAVGGNNYYWKPQQKDWPAKNGQKGSGAQITTV
jgi:hypothetical protein